MRVIILHLSDMHFRCSSNPVLSRVDKIADSLNLCSDEDCNCFIVISGDVANEGAAKEYKVAHEFVSRLIAQLRKNRKIKEIHSIVVPGNHDCNFNSQKSTRDAIIRSLQEDSAAVDNIDFDFVNDLTDIQANFQEFAESLQGKNSQDNSLYCLRHFKFDRYDIRVFCINTAWISEMHEAEGKLLFPVHLIDLNEFPISNNTLLISVFHHPYNWFNTDHRKLFENLINKNSDIIITGHEHDIDSFTNLNVRGQVKEIMKGGLLQYKDEKNSSFNIEVIDLQARLQKKLLLVWDDKNNYYEIDGETELSPFLCLGTRDIFSIKGEYKKILNRLDIQISHPQLNTPLAIDDVYVDPILEIEYAKKGILSKTRERANDLSRLIEIIKEYNKVLLLGNKYYGKTIVLKKIYALLLEEDIVPLYCTGKDLRLLAKHINSNVKKLFEEQYENLKDVPYEKYRQLPIDKKALLIDDIHQSGLDLGKIETFLEIIQRHFGLLVLTSNPIIDLNEMFTNPGALIEYTRVKLCDFSLPIISDVVEKWTRLSNPEALEEEIQHRIKSLENTLFKTIGKSIVPRNPFFILTILYNLEKSGSPDAQTGAHGYYFQTIINIMVAKVSEHKEQIGYIYDYFSELAFRMLSNSTGKIRKGDLINFNSSYIHDTAFDLDLDRILEKSIREEILKCESDIYSFTFMYYLEYFVAYYIAHNITNPKQRKSMLNLVEQMTMHLHKEIYSNIIMFTCFLTRDYAILDIVTDKSNRLFNKMAEFKMTEDVDFLNKLSPYTRIRSLSGKPAKETKREMLEATDEVSTEIGNSRYDLHRDVDDLKDLSIINTILYAFAAVKVSGQIVRIYLPGDLDDRIKLTKDCYDLGLKTIKYVFDQFRVQIPTVQEGLAQCILERNPSISNEELSVATNDWIWTLSQSICMSSIKNVSSNVGAPELRRMYELILDRYPSLAYEFINISIELDHFKDFPEGKILDLAHRLDKFRNYFCKDLLCLLFIYHVYQFYEPINKLQRIASALGLEQLISEANIFLPGRKLLPRGKASNK